jgi:flagellin
VLTEATVAVQGVADQTVLQNAESETVAVKVGDYWYDPADVSAKDNKLVVDKGAKEVTLYTGTTLTGVDGFITEGTATVQGVEGQTVMLNEAEEVVAVKVGDDWYAPDDVEVEDGAIVASDGATSIDFGEGVALAGAGGIDVSSTREAADSAIKVIDDAIVKVSGQRSELGAVQNRLEHTIANLGTSAENLQAAEARIRDLDMAEEIMAFTKNNILQQAATAMLAQANMAPQSVLQLLG